MPRFVRPWLSDVKVAASHYGVSISKSVDAVFQLRAVAGEPERRSIRLGVILDLAMPLG